MFSSIANFILDLVQGLGYLGLTILMAIESSFIPMPSEVIIPPAAFLVHHGVYKLVFVFLAGLLGSIIGAIFNYFLAYYLGRPLVYSLAKHRFAKFLLISPEKIERAEKYFLKNANRATFFGRLIPVIRQLISIPAGFVKMPFLNFLLYTSLGSAIWVAILTALGYFLGAQEALLKMYYRELSWGLVIIVLIWLGFKITKIINKKNSV